MKLVSSKKIANLSIILYVLGVVVAGFFLYRLPDVLLNNTQAIGVVELNEIKPFLNRINIVVAAVLLAGFLAIVMISSASNNRSSENVIYVESFEQKKEEIKEEAQQEEQKEETGQKHQNISQGIEKIKNQDAGDNTSRFNDALSLICNELEASQAAAYFATEEKDHHYIQLFAAYAYPIPESEVVRFEYGEGLAGQVAKEKKVINIDDVPEGYIRILSGLGSASPTNLIIIPALNHENDLLAVAEIASFKPFTEADEEVLTQVFNDLGGLLEAQKS